ncbi:MAG: Mrp/NBP35 family ATP-binding protein [Bacteroidia bacterium]|nr:Mrp/NBP35 family ATP-binding protein [Bacteroidia bacterium]
MDKDKIIEVLKTINHPEEKTDIVSSGILVNISGDEKKVKIILQFKKPVDALANSVKRACIQALNQKFGNELEFEIENIFPQRKIEERIPFKDVKKIIAVASGKGGVGKSTVAANLAVALANKGLKVGLFDADIYGPSVPKMFGVEDEKPPMKKIDGREYISTVEKFGVKLLSVGFFVSREQALIWRGAMATSAIKQLMEEGDWGELDVVVLDMPPGTSDIHLTLVQSVAVTGVVIVTTPQEVALADALKGVNMFRNKDINVPVLGLVENMAWFTPEELPENKYYLFGNGGGKRLAEELEVPLLGQIPIVQSICEAGDAGTPVALNNNRADGKAFANLAEKVLIALEERNQKEKTKKVEITK